MTGPNFGPVVGSGRSKTDYQSEPVKDRSRLVISHRSKSRYMIEYISRQGTK